MIVRNLGSGSGGNATIVAADGRAIVVDAGISARRIRNGCEGMELEAVLITHRHRDHLGPATEKLWLPVFAEENNWKDATERGWVSGKATHFDGEPFQVGPFQVTAFPLPHPGNASWQCFGFRIAHGKKVLAYATDLGHVPDEFLDVIAEADAVYLESNHDPEMELQSRRGPEAIEWVLSDHGHLSNEQCSEALRHAKNAKNVILAHLSRECNTSELARESAESVLSASVHVQVAQQTHPIADAKI